MAWVWLELELYYVVLSLILRRCLLGVVPGFLSLNGTLSSFSGDIFGGESLGISVLLPLNLSCVDQKDSPPSLGLLSKNSFIIQKKQSSNSCLVFSDTA